MYITVKDKDIIGELGNISTGAAATTLSTLLNSKVKITVPCVEELKSINISKFTKEGYKPIIITFKEGLLGNCLLFVKDEDIKLITDTMTGSTGYFLQGDLSEMHISAICEVMNQMFGSICSVYSQICNCKVDIGTPLFVSDPLLLDSDRNEEDQLVSISFSLAIDGKLTSQFFQILPINTVQFLIEESKLIKTKEVI